MPGSESFDAFYARTMWSVTSQMHALAGEDSAADHAIREAYARAYQQWYEIADNPDTEGWVLAVAKEAYARRRPQALAQPPQQVSTGPDSLSWPGLYRPRASAATDDPAATVGRPRVGTAAAPTIGAAEGPAAELSGRPTAGGIGLVQGAPTGATAALPGADQAVPPSRPGPPGLPRRHRSPSSRRNLVALTAAIAVILAGGAIYLATRGQPGGTAQPNTANRKHGPVMLPAGQTGSRSAVPWSLVGPGWTLAEVSSGTAGTNQPGTITTYLVDPEGGRYQIRAGLPGVRPLLLAWSRDTQEALFAVPGTSGATYELLSTRSGDITVLPLPPNVTAVGFTRPDGLNILAVKQNPDAFKLQRYNLQGELQSGAAAIASLPRKTETPEWLPGCGTTCGALSSPNGDFDVWGVAGDEMQVVSNAGGKATKLTVPGSTSCVPLTWQDNTTVLASCNVTGQSSQNQLWLVPADGGASAPVTNPSGHESGAGYVTGAWLGADGATYVNETTMATCPGNPSGPGGLAIATVSGGSLQPVRPRGIPSLHISIVSVTGGKLLVLAQTRCPSSSSLLQIDPLTGATTTVLAVPASQVGVLAAVPYGGLEPTATNEQ